MNKSTNINDYLLLVVLTVIFAAMLLLIPLENRSEIFLIVSVVSILGGIARRSTGRTRALVYALLLFLGAAYLVLRSQPLILASDLASIQQALNFDLARWLNTLLALPLLLASMYLVVQVMQSAPVSSAQRLTHGRFARAVSPVRRALALLPWQTLMELLLVTLVAWKATDSLHNFTSQVQLTGVDMVELTRSADFAGQFLRTSGKIPLWDPFIGNGEPMLESVQAFILNPLMSFPIMLLGAKPGVLVVVLLHAVLFGWGGWLWARVMGLGAAGRLLMGALLVSSGSFTGALSHGVFELGISQAYVPFVYAGLIAMLYLPRQRWGLVLLVTATALLIFSGSFWYLLPTAVGSALIVLFALVRFKGRRPRIDLARLRMVLLAGVLVLGVGAVRLMTVRRDLLMHPSLNYNFQMSYAQVLVNYFDPNYTTDKSQWFAVYHYVVPSLLALAVVPLALLSWRWLRPRFTVGWRVLLAGALVVVVMSGFGTGPTPFIMSLYAAFPPLADWRNPGRMAAAASPWVVLVVAWAFDQLARLGGVWFRREALLKGAGALALAALAAAGTFSVLNVANNWPESLDLVPTENMFPTQAEAARVLRQLYPSQMLAIHTGWIEHFTLNEMLIRHTYGDNEVFTIGLPPTIGGEQQDYDEEFAFGDTPDSGNGIWLHDHGYVDMQNVPVDDYLGPILEYNPTALPYAFVVPEQTLIDRGSQGLSRAQTTEATYFHRIDQVEVDVSGATDGSLVVAQETAYPGWTVTVNGQRQPIQSVHRRIAVRLPPGTPAASVVFSYQPDALYQGGLITVISIVLLAAYALRADRLILLARKRGAAPAVAPVAVTAPTAAPKQPDQPVAASVPVPVPVPVRVPAPAAAPPRPGRPLTAERLLPDAVDAVEQAVDGAKEPAPPNRRSARFLVGAVVGAVGIAVVSVVALRASRSQGRGRP